jgi:hypothetical protein
MMIAPLRRNLEYAAGIFDQYFDAPLEWPAGERRDKTTGAVKKAFVIAQGSEPNKEARKSGCPLMLRIPRPLTLGSYFCQISYGSYSGAFPTEKITWGKLDENTPMFLIESDATIVAPLIFASLLDG